METLTQSGIHSLNSNIFVSLTYLIILFTNLNPVKNHPRNQLENYVYKRENSSE